MSTEAPSTQTTRQLCTFVLEKLSFGIDVTNVQEVIRYLPMTRIPLAPPAVFGLINLRGQIVTAIDLRTQLALSARPTGQDPMNVVVHTAEGVVSLLVDEIGDVVEVEESAFERTPETLEAPLADLIRGVYKLNGRLLLALNVHRATEVA